MIMITKKNSPVLQSPLYHHHLWLHARQVPRPREDHQLRFDYQLYRREDGEIGIPSIVLCVEKTTQ